MIIRKLFKFEGSHIVRNCTSDRCSHSLHGHSYKVELFLTADHLDNAGMVVDFGLLAVQRIGCRDAHFLKFIAVDLHIRIPPFMAVLSWLPAALAESLRHL